MKNRKLIKGISILLVFVMILCLCPLHFVHAAEKTLNKAGVYDATAAIAYCDGSNPNGVGSYGVTFEKMDQVDSKILNATLGYKGKAMMSSADVGPKAAFVMQFVNPIDTNKLEYMTLRMFAGLGAKVRVYDSSVKNFTEDTATDVLYFSDWVIEEKTLALKKYADEDGMVRDITFYVVKADPVRRFIIDSYEFTAVKKAKKDLVLKSTVNTYYSSVNMGENQVPTFRLSDQGILAEIGWDNAVYIDGAPERIWKPGRYVSLEFDQVNTAYYDKIYIDFFTKSELEFTLYAYSADELEYNKKNADQVVTMKGGAVTTLVLDAAKFADKAGYLSEINLLFAAHSGADQNAGFQAFFGDITFRLPREKANVTVYLEKVGGGYEKSNLSTTMEGMPGDKVKISPYTAEELGLYGYVYNASAGNVLSCVLQEGKVLDLKLYYSRKICKVTIHNDDETIVVKKKYGTTIDLMEYRKENMLMNILADGIAVEGTTVEVSGDMIIDITQSKGNYVFFMVDDELYATRTYTGEAGESFSEPVVPIREGYHAAWEEYTLDGGDKTVHAVYSEPQITSDDGVDDTGVIVNVASKVQEVVKDSGVPMFVWLILVVVAVLAALIAILAVLTKKGKIGKKQWIATGVSVAVCATAVAIILVVNQFGLMKQGTQVAGDSASNYKFDELFASSDAQAIKPDETLSFDIDKKLGDKNYIQIDVDTDVNLIGTIEYYNIKDQSQTNVEDFFIEAASEETFYQFLDNFRSNGSGLFEKHLTKITLTNITDGEGSVTVNKVAISDREIDLTKAELYVENEYLKVGMDLICGGALTYLESLPRDGQKLEEVLTADGDIQLGLNYSQKEGAKLLSDSVNLINISDKGREVQQSFYANVGEEQGYTRGNYVALDNQDWPYNPVQGGDQDNNSSQIIDYRIEDNLLYVKTRAMDWGQHNSTTKSYMENWYTLSDDMLVVKNRFIDWNGFGECISAINSEMPAVYFAQALDTFVTYDGDGPWTGATLDRQKNLGFWADEDGSYPTKNPSEGWFAWVNEDDYGVGFYVPGITRYASGRLQEVSDSSHKQNSDAASSSMLADYRPDRTSDYTQSYVSNTDYTAPILTTTMDAYVPLEYSYVIRVDSVESLRTGFQNMDFAGTIDNSGLTVWDDETGR